MAKDFHLELDSSVDEVFDELPGNSFLALRKLRWSPNTDFRLDMRKWFTNNEGEEIAGKGVAFMTDEGPGNLVNILLSLGYGDTKQTLDGIKDREDFIPEVAQILVEKGYQLPKGMEVEVSNGSGDFYDPKELFPD